VQTGIGNASILGLLTWQKAKSYRGRLGTTQGASSGSIHTGNPIMDGGSDLAFITQWNEYVPIVHADVDDGLAELD
jgi:hypothetical protein